ncbi:MAG: hypothetical protein KL840_25575 [Aquamicrobium sp.]|nr:hypothetical protein [Aquamicrobium sp.]
MKLRPIEIGEAGKAAALLAEGFPSHSHEAWAGTVERLFAHVQAIGETSIGQFVMAGGDEIGLCLAIPSYRMAYADPPTRIVNLASFFLRPGHEWMAPLLMRRLTADRSVEYTDLTASPSMRKINRQTGFVDHSEGSVFIPVPVAALRAGRGARVLPLGAIRPGALPDAHIRLLEQHAALGSIAVALEVHGTCHPLILTSSPRRRMPSARVILVRDRQLIRKGLGPIARHLMKRGFAFLEFDARAKVGFPEAMFRTEVAPVQSTRDTADEAIDHTFSEMVFLRPG